MKNGIGMALVIGVLMAVLGFFLGRKSVGAGDESAPGTMRGGSAPGISAKSDRNPGANEALDRLKGTDGRPASPEAAMRAVIRKLERSPIMGMDYDAMFEAYAVIREMGAAEVRAALAELEGAESNPQVKMMLQMLLVNHWAKEEGQEALEYVLAQSDTRMKAMGVMGGVMAWMREEPDAAYDWYQEHKSEVGGGMFGGGGMIEGMMIASMGQRDMAGAFEKLATLGQESKQMALTTMASQMGMDPAQRTAFLEHLEGIDDEPLRKQTLQGMVSSWAWQDPEGAGDFIVNGEFDDETRRQLKSSVAQSWANMDPKGAMEWSIGHSDGEERVGLVAQSFGNWARQDPEAADAWLQGQPAELKSDQLYSATTQQLMYSQRFEQAAEYAGRIGDEATQLESMRTLHQMWTASDEAGAGKWLETLDAPLRESVIQGAREPGAMPWNLPKPGEVERAVERAFGDAPADAPAPESE